MGEGWGAPLLVIYWWPYGRLGVWKPKKLRERDV
jgi:hypothetical protein